MLKNRSLRVKMVKDSEDTEYEPIDYEKIIEAVTKGVSTCIAVYIAGDIVRRFVIYAITAKI